MAAKRSTEDGSPCATEDREDSKRVKPDTTDTTASVHTVLQNLHGFFNKEVLNVNNNTKTVFLRCGLKERKGDAIVILEKTTFKEEQFDRILTDETSLQQQLHNDIYGTYVGLLSAELNGKFH